MISIEATNKNSFDEYVRLLLRLHDLIVDERCDSTEADEIRDDMDEPWDQLDMEQTEQIRGLSADLYTIGVDRPSPPGVASEKESAAFNEAVRKEDWPAVLSIVRAHERELLPFEAAYIRGVCWAHLKQPDVAIRFLREAQRLKPLEPLEENWLLLAHICAHRSAEVVDRAREIIFEGLDPLLSLTAAQVLSVRASELREPEADTMRSAAIEAAEQALARSRQAPADELVDVQRLAVLHLLAIDYAEQGDLQNARRVCEAALSIAPENLDSQMIHDWLRNLPTKSIPAVEMRKRLPVGAELNSPRFSNFQFAASNN